MKKCLFAVLLCVGLFSRNAFCVSPPDVISVNNGLTDLQNDDVYDANANFAAAVAFNPTNQDANLLLAATRIAVLAETPAGSNFLNGLGFAAAGRNYYNPDLQWPTNSKGDYQFPSGYNTSTAITFYTNYVMAALAASLTNLANVTAPTYQLYLPGTTTLGTDGSSAQDVTVDYGDVQVLRALLTAGQFIGYTAVANNSDVNMSWVQQMITNKTLTIQSFLAEFTSLGTLQNASALAPSEAAGTNAINLYFGASYFILNDRTVANPLFNLSTNDYPQEAVFRGALSNALLSLTAPTQFASNNVGSTIYAKPYFSGMVSPRKLFPNFTGDAYVDNSLPDYTFGGMLPDEPSYITEKQLRKLFSPVTGIYVGYVADTNSGNAGDFVFFYNASGQAYIVGYDQDVLQNISPPQNETGAFSVPVTVNALNQWKVSSGSITGSGTIDKNGNFSGSLNLGNGQIVQLYDSYEVSPPGDYQTGAGYYTGTFSGSANGQAVSGSLAAILDAQGDFAVHIFDPAQSYSDAGATDFGNQYNSLPINTFSLTTIDGLTLYGTNNPSTFKITGNFNGGNVSGTFTMSLSASIGYDTPPDITTDLPSYFTVGLTNVTVFSLGVSGSAPLSYQWYLNGSPIPGATNSTLTASSSLWGNPTNVNISASVNNVVGGTNSQTCYVTVLPSLPLAGSYAGIYTGNSTDGTNGVSDSFGYYSGAFAVSVSTNGQLIIIGQDDGDGTDDGYDFGFYINTTLKSGGGDFQYQDSYVSASGYVDTMGDFFAQLYYPQANSGSGEWVYLNGNLQSPLGPFQNTDGYYSGPYTGAYTGTLDVIFDANGDICYVPVNTGANGNPYGPPGHGGFGQFYSSTQFLNTSITGTTIGGTLNPATFVITGGYTNTDNTHGTYTVTRSGVVPHNPPVITTDLPLGTVVGLGNTTVFSLGVTGSTPLFFQWYTNDVPIPGATSSTLAVSNNLWMTTGVYDLSATVSNVVGSANSQTDTVTVTAESFTPTVAITSPTPGQLWSNSTFTVTGTASDPLAVTGVVCSVNGFLETVQPNPTYSNWNSLVGLNPGSNTISAYSINNGFIHSHTNTVLMNYIVTAPLEVETDGDAIITPNLNGAQLVVGKTYSMTATAINGFSFQNWEEANLDAPAAIHPATVGEIVFTPLTNKPTLSFQMEPNLILLAELNDTEKPFLSITNVKAGFTLNSSNSDGTYTVMGVATDNVAVANVNYSFNGSPYTNSAATNGIQWSSAQLQLMAGTNTYSAYAVDTSGNISTTSTVQMVYVVTAKLTVQTNGPGTVNPNDNNVWLQIGKNYSLTATPAAGFMLTNWMGLTNGVQVLFTNKPTVTFMMQTNLVMQPTFVDTLKPYLKVTNPVSATAFVYTNSYTVMGVVTDDQEVATITYSLAGGDPPVGIYANISGWQANLSSLMAGTNVFTVYAQATNGNYSVTDTVDIVEISTNPLTVQTSGKGTISPNYSNAWLDVGRNYSMTATPASGFIFSNWTGGVGSPTAYYTNKPTVTFMMETGLVMQATFMDTLKPYLKITNPISPVTFVTSNSYQVMGVATDDEELASVKYSFDGGPYTTASFTLPPGFVQSAALLDQPSILWSSQPLTLMAGTNVVSVYAVATNGNYSVTNTVDIVEISSNQLTVQTVNKGTISPNYSNAWLQVGRNYSMTATPASGFIFSNWTGGVDSPTTLYTNKPTVTFMMETGLVMQATFIDTLKPYLKITNPLSSGTLVYTNTYTFMGVATDDEAVASVNYSLNGGAYAAANTNGIQWNVPLTLSEGTNTFAVYAMATNGNVSATNQITILRLPTFIPFIIATNNGSTYIQNPQAQIAFDGTNYLVVYQVYPVGGGSSYAVGQFVSQSGFLTSSPLTLNPGGSDDPPYLDFDGANYLVAWADYSDEQAGVPIRGTFVNPVTQTPGPVLTLSQSTTVTNFSTIVYGGGEYFLMWADNRNYPAPDSIYGRLIDTSGNVVSNDFLISTNGRMDEAGGVSAAFDGDKFLAVWGSASGNTSINGQLINGAGPVGSPFVIYTNSTPAGIPLPSVTFNEGTNFLVLFNTGISPANIASSFHILGRFVTPAGTVLTNQVTLTTDAGPQVVPSADVNGTNYFITWNQGLNPFVHNTSAMVMGRFFNLTGNPTSPELQMMSTPILKYLAPILPLSATQLNAEIPLWAPVIWDGQRFVLVGGLGQEIGTSLQFTNGVIYGELISP